jgi:MazG family protein
MGDAESAGKKFEELVRILDALRGEKGCPWDKEQDEKSIADYFLEEVYEAVDSIYANDSGSLEEELGDVLMEVVFLARIFKEKEEFLISEVLDGINRKMIRRHPHVFSKKRIETSEEVRDEWCQQKKEEKERQSVLDGIASSLPSLLESFQLGLRVSQFGFDWDNSLGALQKVKEEISELEEVLKKKEDDEVFKEVGDLFFAMSNVSRHLGINPEIALRQANKKFMDRFRFIEEKLEKKGKTLVQASLEEMDKIWDEAKDKIK